jgi:hypothetical protein
LKSLKVDGGGTHNNLLMQFQADMINVPVVKPKVMETTAMGAAFGAGLAVGVWKDLQEIRALWSIAETFEPNMPETERQKNWAGWQKAVTKSLDWIEDDEDDKFEDAIEGQGDIEEQKAETKTTTATRGFPFDSEVERTGYGALSLMLVAALGAGAGFLLGRQRRY